MQKFKYLLFLFCAFLATNSMIAQNQNGTPTSKVIEEATVQVTYAEKVGNIPPIRTLVPVAPTDPEKKKWNKKKKKVPANFIGRGKSAVAYPELEHTGPDPLRQTGFNKSVPVEGELKVNVDGIFANGSPSDPSGDIGQDHYVQAVNVTTIGVYDKEGNQVTTFTGNTLWSSIGFSSAGDPIVLYDQIADRWLITEFPSGNQLLVAISDDSDPLGSYTAYNFATPSFPDYPKYGIWDNSYTVTTNENGATNLVTYLIDRQSMLNGDNTVEIQRVVIPGPSGSEQGFIVAAAADWVGETPPNGDPIFLALNDGSWSGTGQDVIELYTIDVDYGNQNNTTVNNTTIPVTNYDSNPCSAGPGFSCATQPGAGSAGLDALPEIIMHQPNYRNFGSHESLLFNFITDVTDGQNLIGIRWIEFRRSGDTDWSVYQEGTYAPDDGNHRFMGGIAMDGNGNIGLAFNISGDDEFAGIRFTGRRAGDPLGEMTVDETIVIDGLSTLNSNGRFADYSHISIDPTDDKTFWFTSEYAGGNGSARTRIFSFAISRDSVDIGPSSVQLPVSDVNMSANEPVAVNVTNFGIETQSAYQVGFIFEDEPAIIAEVTNNLDSDEESQYLFLGETVDMSEIGDYEFTFFTILEGDEVTGNDTLRTIVKHLPRWDAGITAIDGFGGANCASEINVTISISNFGADELNSADVEVLLNGVFYETINWTGNLAIGETEEIDLVLTGFNGGQNTLSATTSNPNGETDQIMDNDGFTQEFQAIIGGAMVTLALLTDNFPDETTWELLSESGTTLIQGGPYGNNATLYEEEWCLSPGGCYTFDIADSYGDGICCNPFTGNGNYAIIDAEGNNIVASDGQFGNGETIDFCVDGESNTTCLLTADFATSRESSDGASDGAILVTPQNGTNPFEYSIDDGISFQNSNVFDGLNAGDYKMVVKDANDCLHEETVTLGICALDAMADVTDASDDENGNGIIEVSASSIEGTATYSLDGTTFQSENVFEGLTAGDYTVYVQDDSGCLITLDVVIETWALGIEETTFGQIIEVFPNPTEGVFRVNVKGLDQESVFLPLEIYDINGKRIYGSNLVRYDDTFTGQLSLYAYSSGIYFIRFMNADVEQMVRIVKE